MAFQDNVLNKPYTVITSYPKISVIIVNFNGGRLLADCIESVLRSYYPDFEVLVVDNGSTDGSTYEAERKYKQIKVIYTNVNLGFGHGNNLGVHFASGEYLAFLNPDTTVDPHWLTHLVNVITADPGIGLATPKILISSSPDKINTCGNNVHFTGMPSCRRWMQDENAANKIAEVCSISGAAFIIKKQLFTRVFGFDDRFFMYAEDTDLSWRIMLLGFRCVTAPASVVYHEYIPRFGPQKYYFLERNRYQALLKNFRWRTLLLLLPAFFLAEVVTWGYAFIKGRPHIKAKFNTYRWVMGNLSYILHIRKLVQAQRKTPDRNILQLCSSHMEFSLVDMGWPSRIASALVDPLFLILFRMALLIVNW